MKHDEVLSTKLWKIAHIIVEQVNELKQSKSIVKSIVPYLKPRFERFEYHEGNISSQWEYETIEKEEWSWPDETKFMESEIKKLPAYSDSFKLISKLCNVNLSQAEFWLSRFCHVIARNALNSLTDERLLELIVSFIGDLEGSPCEWSPIVWLKGIWMKDEVVKVNDEIKLRKPRREDLEFEQSLDLYPLFDTTITHEHPMTIVEVKHRAKNQPEIHGWLEKFVTTLRLFKLGSVVNIRTQWISRSLLQFGGTHFRHEPISTAYKYSIGESNAEALSKFIARIMPLIPKEVTEPGTGTVDHVVISLLRYNDAVLKPEIVESRLTYGIMSLEALYLKATEREELAHRLGQRVGKVLASFGYQPLEVYNTLKQAYKIRSKFIHGSKIEKEELQNATRLTEKTLEYARTSIVMYLQLKEKIEKENFLSLVNNSMLSEAAGSKLNKLLRQSCLIL